MSDFDYDKAEADLYDSGCPNSEEIYEYRSERGIDDFMRENGLNPDNYRGGSSGSGGSDSGSSGCYLTTACVEAMGCADNCVELNVLREYRDKYLKNREHGQEEIKFYYANAPKIVAAINARDDSKTIWGKVYYELIIQCIGLIGHHKLEAAHALYRKYTHDLLSQYVEK